MDPQNHCERCKSNLCQVCLREHSPEIISFTCCEDDQGKRILTCGFECRRTVWFGDRIENALANTIEYFYEKRYFEK